MAYVTLVGINFLPEIILIDFNWVQFHKLQCMNKMFISPCIWMIQVDSSDEWLKTKIGGLVKHLLHCLFLFTYLSHLNPYSNIVSNYLSNWKCLLPAA